MDLSDSAQVSPDKPPKLSDKQRRFAEEYAIDSNATAAAIRAGYSPRSARTQGPLLLRDPAIRQLAEARIQAARESNALSPQRVLEELRRLAFFDCSTLYDPDTGQLLPIHQMPPEARSALKSVETYSRNLSAGDGKVEQTIRAQTWDKSKALELLAKHFRLIDNDAPLSGTLVIRHELILPDRPHIVEAQPLSPPLDTDILPHDADRLQAPQTADPASPDRNPHDTDATETGLPGRADAVRASRIRPAESGGERW